jgi:hypothetical protein
MPKRFDHFGEHHADEDFIFDQEYGCLAEHVSGRLWSYRKRFCSSRKRLAPSPPPDHSVLHQYSKKPSPGLRSGDGFQKGGP